MAKDKALLDLEIPGLKLFRRGKVRNVYDLGDKLLFVATDRISAFDVVMKNGIPDKGKVLNLISVFWFDFTSDVVKNHVITADIEKIVTEEPKLAKFKKELDGRCMLVKKAEPIPVECIVRGYISGSGWKDYKSTGKISGVNLPIGIRESDRLPEPIFTPSTKAEEGHDQNISQEEAARIAGQEVYEFLKEKSIAIYMKASEYARTKGIIIADTKFEFGKLGEEIILMDEVLTPDSSRFWPVSEYQPGKSQKSFDKQFVRDYLEIIGWEKTPPGPELPEAIVTKTSEKYIEAYRLLTGKEF